MSRGAMVLVLALGCTHAPPRPPPPSAAEFQARRSAHQPKTGDEAVACGQQFAVWDRWNDAGPHEEQPAEAQQRATLEECLASARAKIAELQAERDRQAQLEAGTRQAALDAAARAAAETDKRQPPPSFAEEQATQRRAREDAIDSARQDAELSRLAVSGEVCWFRSLRAWAKQEIAKEHGYGRQSGVVNPTWLGELGGRLRQADEGERAAKGRLGKRKMLACGDPRVASVVECLRDAENGHPDSCDQPEALLAIDETQ